MKITVYTHRDDPYCEMLKNLLRYHHIDFDTIEVSRNIKAHKHMEAISGQTHTPVIVIDDKVFVGFDREKIKEVLGLPEDNTQP